MKKIILAMLFLVPSVSNAAWVGKLDLQSSVQPMLLREVGNGQWLAGISHPNLYHVDYNGIPIFHAGLFQAWNAENGNASFGPLIGIDLVGVSKVAGVDIPATIAAIGESVGLPTLFKPATLFASMLSLDAFVGYRPIHTADVSGEVVYGGAAGLSIPFGVKELSPGV